MKRKLLCILVLALCLASCQNENTKEVKKEENLSAYDQALDLIEAQAYHQAIDLLEGQEDHQSDLARIKAYSGLGKYSQALAILENQADQEAIPILNLYGHLYNHQAQALYRNSFYVKYLVLDQAISYFQKVLDQDPANQEALFGISRAYKMQGYENDKALLYAEQAADIQESQEINVYLLDHYLTTYNEPAFKDLIENLYAQAPDNYTYAKYYGQYLEKFSSPDQTIDHYEQMSLDFPKQEGVKALVANYYLQNESFSESLEEIMSLNPLEQDDLVLEIYLNILLANNKLDQVEDSIDYLFKHDKKAMAYYFKSQMAYRQFDWQGTIDNLILSLDHQPDQERHSLLLEKLINTNDTSLFKDVFMAYINRYPINTETIEQVVYLMESVDDQDGLMNEIYQVLESDVLLVVAGDLAYSSDNYDLSLQLINKTLTLDPNDNSEHELTLYAIVNYLDGQKDLGLQYFEKADGTLLSLYLLQIDTFSMSYHDFYDFIDILKDYQVKSATVKEAKKALSHHQDDPFYTLIVADVYHHFDDDVQAIKYLDKAIALDPRPLFIATKLQYQYSFNRHLEAEETAQLIINDPEYRREALYYLGLIYKDYNDVDQSISYFESLIEESQPNDTSFSIQEARYNLARFYTFFKGDTEEAQVHIDAYVSNEDFLDEQMEEVKSYINTVYDQNNDSDFIKGLFENYYYTYDAQVFNDFEGDLSDQEVKDLINQLKNPNDPYTYVVFDESKSKPTSQGDLDNVVYRQLSDDLHYIDINNFGEKVQYQVIYHLDHIDKKDTASLIFDLRDNPGGYVYGAIDILDQLLGDLVIARDVNRDGSDFKYYSDDFRHRFDQIYILTNEGSASASELFTLSLNSHLENVTVLGTRTRGKGVGQQIFRQNDKGRTYYIVNFTWYVGDRNIQNVGLLPDREMTDNQIQAYFQETYQVPSFE